MLQIPHLVELGINAVELLPVFEYDELEFQRTPNPRDHMVNIWGYSHINFFAPMSRFAADGAGPAAAAKEFKHMVQQLHKAGIEVILDVVYNHTAEGDGLRHIICGRRACMLSLYSFTASVTAGSCLSLLMAWPAAAAKELKHMVQQFHKAGIKAILVVVYNHTAEDIEWICDRVGGPLSCLIWVHNVACLTV